MNQSYNPFRAALAHISLTGEGLGPCLGKVQKRSAICLAMACATTVALSKARELPPSTDRQKTIDFINQMDSRATSHIARMMNGPAATAGPHAYVSNWLYHHVPGYAREWNQDHSVGTPIWLMTQEYRYRWCEHMADQFDRKEFPWQI